MVSSDTVLTHYDQILKKNSLRNRRISSWSWLCSIPYVMPDGSEKTIAFALRTLNDAEKGYPQLQKKALIRKEALSIVWGVKKFQYYLEGRPFTILTDHKLLTTIFHSNKGISATASARILCWALLLSVFSFQIEYKNTKAHAYADGLSRLPLNCTKEDEDHKDPVDIFH